VLLIIINSVQLWGIHMRNRFLCGVATLALMAATAGPVLAADLPLKAAPAPVYAAPNWAGFYLGGHIGYGFGKFTGDESAFGPLTAKVDGVAVGIHTGYNWQVNQIVFGLEGDLSGTFGNNWGKSVFTCPVGCTNSGLHGELNGLASIRGRLGWAFDRTLIYATGGVAWGLYKSIAGASGILQGPPGIQSHVATGGVIGAGIEWKYKPNLSFRLEGLDYIFNKTTAGTSSQVGTGNDKINNVVVVRVGASYHF
jgi:outer membrane immunogenic protein